MDIRFATEEFLSKTSCSNIQATVITDHDVVKNRFLCHAIEKTLFTLL